MKLHSSSVLLAALLTAAMAGPGFAAPPDTVAAAQKFGQERGAISAQPDGLLVAEGEEFQTRSPGWKAKSWGENYYAATFANTFLSRKAFIGAPEQCDKSVAEAAIEVPAAGRYLALARYEAAYRFETQFRVQIEQGGKMVLDRLYGARANPKIWAFSQKIKNEVAWDWGAVENVVWEGHDAFVELQAGPATLRLIADKQPEPAAKRNVDLIALTTDIEGVQQRIEKESYLPLDGLLTQSGDVFLKVHNQGGQPVTLQGGGGPSGGVIQEHSPYWVHLRNWPKLAPIEVSPGGKSEWIEVGGLLDTLNDGQLTFTAQGEALNYSLEFGVKTAAGEIKPIAKFDGTEAKLPLAFHADTRYSHLLRHQEQVLFDLLDYLKAQPQGGKPPVRTPLYAATFKPTGSAKHQAAAKEFRAMFGILPPDDSEPTAANGEPRGYIDVRGVPTEMLADYCQKLGTKAQQIRVVSLGDEIGLPAPAGATANDDFRAWLKTQGVKPADVLPAAGDDWSQVSFSIDPQLKATAPGQYYWSMRYQYHYGIAAIKQRTDIVRQHLPHAQIGANFSPHHGGSEHSYLGQVFQWVSCFRDDGMMMPWSEDYIWQLPVCSPQVNNLSLDLARAGIRGKEDREIMFYVMPHWPGNTPQMWRRLFYGALGHGATMLNLFEFQPVQVAYTENHCSLDAMYGTVLRGMRELGEFEDIIQDGHVRPAEVGLWFSETADIWHDNAGSFAAAKRALYTSLRQQQLPVDVVVEQDALNGTLSQYKVLYLTDQHVTGAASQKISAWVEAGGTLFASAGAGMFDELNRPNTILRKLLGVEQTALDSRPDQQIGYIKQDLPFAKPLEVATWKFKGGSFPMPAFGVRSRFQATSARIDDRFQFSDGSPAVANRQVGQGQVQYFAFLPSLSYYHSAIPQRPVDRGSTDDAMAHFLPTEFNEASAAMIRAPTAELTLPVDCSQPLVESCVIEAPQGKAIALINWNGAPVKGLRVEVNLPVPQASVTLASGAAVKVETEATQTILTLDLDEADAVIFR
ncbi:MAG: beta-galactosidase trimerization domain-containing protein [Pirellulales bacterium]